MIILGIGIGIVVGVCLMGIIRQGKIEALEHKVARLNRLSGKVK